MSHDTAGADEAGAPGDGSAGLTSVSVRRERMLALIEEREFARVAELSTEFGISAVTVRNDLDALATLGRIHRFRGGATPRPLGGRERAYEETEGSYAAEKVAIGCAAAELVENGDSVILDVGTTAVAAARALVARSELRDVTVFTNGLKTALELEPAIGRLTVVVLGGTLRRLQHSLVNPMATVLLGQLRVATVFVGCTGVDPVAGITNVNLPEAEVKQQMLGAGGRRIVLADGSKIGRVDLAQLCPAVDVDLVITGTSADPSILSALDEAGCEVRVAP